MPTVSGLTILRNGITCGYTFIETIKCLDAICDEIIIIEGNSSDDTMNYINQIKNDKFKIYSQDWHNGSNGYTFKDVTNLGLSKCTKDYVFYLQADEVIHENDYDKLRALIDQGYDAISVNFIHLRYSMLQKIKDNAYTEAYRIIKNHANISSIDDGYSFGGNIQNPTHSHINVFHAGYVFVKNILLKMINHADNYYQTNDNYQYRKLKSIELLNRLNNGETLDINDVHRILEPFYELVDHQLELPGLLSNHIGAMYYDPKRNLRS